MSPTQENPPPAYQPTAQQTATTADFQVYNYFMDEALGDFAWTTRTNYDASNVARIGNGNPFTECDKFVLDNSDHISGYQVYYDDSYIYGLINKILVSLETFIMCLHFHNLR